MAGNTTTQDLHTIAIRDFPESPIIDARVDALSLFGRWIYDKLRWSELTLDQAASDCYKTKEWVVDLQNGSLVPGKHVLVRLSLALDDAFDEGKRPVDVLSGLNTDPWSRLAKKLRRRVKVTSTFSVDSTQNDEPVDGKSPLAFFYSVHLRDKLLTFGPLVVIASLLGSLFIEHPWSNQSFHFDNIVLSEVTFVGVGVMALMALAIQPLSNCLDFVVRANRRMFWNSGTYKKHRALRTLRHEEHLSSLAGEESSKARDRRWRRRLAIAFGAPRTGAAWYDNEVGWYSDRDEPFLIKKRIRSYKEKAIEADLTERMAIVSMLGTAICLAGAAFAVGQTPSAHWVMRRFLHHWLWPSFHRGPAQQAYWWCAGALVFGILSCFFTRRLRRQSNAVYTRLVRAYGAKPPGF